MDLTAPLIGKAGELRVRSELLLKGLIPASFDQDVGTDIILENGKKLQVKTSLKPIYSKKDYSWRYSFSIRAQQFRSIGDGKYKKRHTRQNYGGLADYFVFWLIEQDVFYIVPEGEVGSKLSLVIATPDEKRLYKKHKIKGSTSKYEKYKNNWEQLR